MRTYKEMIHDARMKGIASEQTTNRSIEDVNELLEKIKKTHEEEYNRFMRKTHERLYGCHYDECMAREDVERMWHTDEKGVKRSGEHWTEEDVESALQGKVFPQGTTCWDIYVAAHIAYHDLSNVFQNSECIKFAYQFFFCDEDATEGKVWRYVRDMM